MHTPIDAAAGLQRRSPPAGDATSSASCSASTSSASSSRPDTSPAAAAARRLRTASYSPGTPPPPSLDAPDTQPADVPPAAGCSRLHRQAHDVVRPRRRLSSQPRTSPASTRPVIRPYRSQDVPLEPLIEPLGRRLVGHRQQNGQRELGRTRAAVAPRRSRRRARQSSAPSTVIRISPLRLSPRIGRESATCRPGGSTSTPAGRPDSRAWSASAGTGTRIHPVLSPSSTSAIAGTRRQTRRP